MACVCSDVVTVLMSEPHSPGKAQRHFPWDGAGWSVKTAVAGFFFFHHVRAGQRRIPVRPRVDSEQRSSSVFDCEVRELRIVTLVSCVSVS